MKLRTARLGVLLVAFLGLMATMIPSASATYYKLVVFTGFATLGGGLGYPGVGQGGTPNTDKIPCTTGGMPDTSCLEVKSGPKGEPMVNFRPEGNHASFGFNSIVCAKVSVSDLKKTPGPALCAISAFGAVWGYCGLSTGIGVATLTNLNPPPLDKATVSTDIKFTGVGGVLYVTGGNMTQNVHAVVSAVPVLDPGGTSCTTKSANNFLLTGVAGFKNIN